MTVISVTSGQTSSGLLIGAGDRLFVRSGGSVSATTVRPAGVEYVSSGGSSFDDFVSRSGLKVISAGGFASGDQVAGEEEVYGSASAITVLSGGEDVFSSNIGAGGLDDQIESGGAELVVNGGVTTSDTVLLGARKYVDAKGSSFDDQIAGVEVDAGGAISGATVVAGGELRQQSVTPGLLVATVLSGGELILDSVVSSGEILSVAPDRIQSTIDQGGVVLSSGAIEKSDRAEIRSGGEVSAAAGAWIFNTALADGAELIGAAYLFSDAEDSGLISGARVKGDLTVFSGGTAEAVIIYGEATLEAGGSLQTATVKAGATLSGDGAATYIKISSGAVASLGGATTSVFVYAGGSAVVDGGVVSGLTVHAGGLVVADGGHVYGISVASGAELDVVNGAAITGLTLAVGADEFFDFVVAYGATRGGDVVGSGGYIDNKGRMVGDVVGASGVAYDYAAGSATTVSAGGEELVMPTGTESGATLVGVSGAAIPGSGAIGLFAGLQLVEGLAQATTVSSGGYQEIVFDPETGGAGRALHTTILAGGVARVDSGAILSGAVVESGGELLIYDRHGAVNNLQLQAGAEIILGDQAATAASIVSGQLIVSSGTTVLDIFNLSGAAASLGVTVTDDGAGGALLTITSGGGMAIGTKRLQLAQALAGFSPGGGARDHQTAEPTSSASFAALARPR